MKTKLIKIFILLMLVFLTPSVVNAASKRAIVHYKTGKELLNGVEKDVNRTPTYDYVKLHMGSIGYAVEGWNDWSRW